MKNLKLKSIMGYVLLSLIFGCMNVFASNIEEDSTFLKDEGAKMKSLNTRNSKQNISLFKVKGNGTFVIQNIPKIDKEPSHINGTFKCNLKLTKKVSNNAKIYTHIKGTKGEVFNDIEGNRNNGIQQNYIKIKEFLYEQALWSKRFKLTLGKLDPTKYFDCNEIAGDETTQFFNSMFVNNPGIIFPSYSLGVRVAYTHMQFINVMYGCFSENENWNNIESANFNIVEADFKVKKNGNYRFMYWKKSLDIDNKIYGFALSFDQAISKDITLFTRFGYQDADITNISENFDELFSNFSSVGTQITGNLWHRNQDKIGLAFGITSPMSKYSTLFSTLKQNTTELYYSLYLNDTITLTPIVALLHQEENTFLKGRDFFSFLIRARINF